MMLAAPHNKRFMLDGKELGRITYDDYCMMLYISDDCQKVKGMPVPIMSKIYTLRGVPQAIIVGGDSATMKSKDPPLTLVAKKGFREMGCTFTPDERVELLVLFSVEAEKNKET